MNIFKICALLTICVPCWAPELAINDFLDMAEASLAVYHKTGVHDAAILESNSIVKRFNKDIDYLSTRITAICTKWPHKDLHKLIKRLDVHYQRLNRIEKILVRISKIPVVLPNDDATIAIDALLIRITIIKATIEKMRHIMSTQYRQNIINLWHPIINIAS